VASYQRLMGFTIALSSSVEGGSMKFATCTTPVFLVYSVASRKVGALALSAYICCTAAQRTGFVGGLGLGLEGTGRVRIHVRIAGRRCGVRAR